ncbi:MarR family winged helix-turn-helix transcriptional regulator [Tessaracoccus caeni]|uniref:MarR family winged helix-turn-helix transcriptional regulator n=1 Tax=Tessaracoccus caeni TaxID=3031239 RepID=UPI0023DC5EEB|nr:MarR family winged helix-turn-helix transcriptional regulator [Tessaracoccus caeni]MDF1488680.1 MarR family winged helix-turn-helix transcriptional regulator [Tessaracoccus caeni]
MKDESLRKPGYELPFLLLSGFRVLVEEAHRRLADRGHADLRPAHGFAMQAVGAGSTTGEVARALGVTKQAASKTIERLTEMGYVAASRDPADARRKIVVPTARGIDMLEKSAVVFDEVYREWGEQIGVEELDGMHEGLRVLVGERALRVDHAGWLA